MKLSKTLIARIAPALLVLLFSGCGLKGDLYFPEAEAAEESNKQANEQSSSNTEQQ